MYFMHIIFYICKFGCHANLTAIRTKRNTLTVTQKEAHFNAETLHLLILRHFFSDHFDLKMLSCTNPDRGINRFVYGYADKGKTAKVEARDRLR